MGLVCFSSIRSAHAICNFCAPVSNKSRLPLPGAVCRLWRGCVKKAPKNSKTHARTFDRLYFFRGPDSRTRPTSWQPRNGAMGKRDGARSLSKLRRTSSGSSIGSACRRSISRLFTIWATYRSCAAAAHDIVQKVGGKGQGRGSMGISEPMRGHVCVVT
jgi:hypothetical protein